MTTSTISAASLALFLELARDAGDWSGQPLFQGTKAQQGNLTQLKQAGLVTSFEDDDEGRVDFAGRRLPPAVFVCFTEAGKALAAQHGVTIKD